MNLRQIRDSKGEEIRVEHKLKLPELKKILAEKFGVKQNQIKLEKIGSDYITGEVTIGNERRGLNYYTDEDHFYIYPSKYKVRFLRETPYGYGGGWETEQVEADSEEEALAKVEEMCKKRWGNVAPCSKFTIVEW